MKITETRTADSLVVALEGRLDTLSAPELEAFLSERYAAVNELVIDMEKLDYISSAGVRVILMAEKTMKDHGKLIIRRPSNLVMGVFSFTGLLDYLTIE